MTQSAHVSTTTTRRKPSLNTAGDLVPIANPEALRQAGIPHGAPLLRKWHSGGRYPRLFLVIDRRVFIDLAEWHALLDAAKAERDARAEKIERAVNG